MISYFKKNIEILVIILIIIGLGFSLYFLSSKKLVSQNQPKQSTCQNDLIATSPVELGNLPPYGNSQAPVKIVEFSDFLCPFCAITAVNFYPKIENLIKEGKVVVYYRDFPVHKDAVPIANAARCANEQGKFWEFNLKIFEKFLNTQNTAVKEVWLSLAENLGLDIKQFEDCLNKNKYIQDVNNDSSYAISLGVKGTPTFFIQSNDKALRLVGINENCLMSAINQIQP